MSEESILLADDLANTSEAGRSRSHLIRDLAAELSRRLNLSLRILYVANTHKNFFTKVQTEKIDKRDKEALTLLKKEMSHYPIRAKIMSIDGEPISSILKQEKKNGAVEMIVLGSQGKRGLQKALIGSVSEEVLRHSISPVIVLGPEARKNKFELPMEGPLRILLLTDLSSASLHAEDYAISLAQRLGAQLTMCYSVGHQIHELKEMIYSRRINNLSIEAVFRNLNKDAERTLTKKVKQAERRRVDVDKLLIKEERKLEDIVPKRVGDAYDLIVMGTHSRNRFLTAFIGSSARNLILKAPIPVIIVRSPTR